MKSLAWGAPAQSKSYVDRGGLDQAFKSALSSNIHVAVHGGSKQGKSWLRSRNLDENDTIVVQCTPGSTPETIISHALARLNVKAEISVTSSTELSGSLDLTANVELGKILAKVRGEAALSGQISRQTQTEHAPIGKTIADLSWVADAIVLSGKRLIIEDFHYVSEETQRQMSFLIKALGEYGLFVIIVGVWPKDHLLSYYNSDLDGRIRDIHLHWSDDDLRRVLALGSDAMRIRLASPIIEEMISQSYGNVGLLQRIIYDLCLREGALDIPLGVARRELDSEASLGLALSSVAGEMQGRFDTFGKSFVIGMRRLREGLAVYRRMLEAITSADDNLLLEGMDSRELLEAINHDGRAPLRMSDLSQALQRMDRLQSTMNINPPVLTYVPADKRVYLVDRLFALLSKIRVPQVALGCRRARDPE